MSVYLSDRDSSRTRPHRRFNPLNGEWVLVSPQRALRPWNGKTEVVSTEALPDHDPNCYLCPGNKRANGVINPKYTGTFVLDNDHPALLPQSFISGKTDSLLIRKPQTGLCRVICYSPRHNLSMSQMSLQQILAVIKTWIKEYQDIGLQQNINHVQIFENRGELMGASNPHPHGQFWATRNLPTLPAKEQKFQLAYWKKHRVQLLLDYLKIELKQKERLVFSNKSFVILVPFWAVWPYETMIIPLKHRQSLLELNQIEQVDLAAILKNLTGRYDRLFSTPFPYSMGIHQAPTDGKKHPEWQLHFHFYPPLLRSATIKKHFVGYEMLAEPQRDITPEAAAERLRHLKIKKNDG